MANVQGATGFSGLNPSGAYGVWGDSSDPGVGVSGTCLDRGVQGLGHIGVDGQGVAVFYRQGETIGVNGQGDVGVFGTGGSVGVLGSSAAGDGVSGVTSDHFSSGVSGSQTSAAGNVIGAAVSAVADAASGVLNFSNSGAGVESHSTTGPGIEGHSDKDVGVVGYSDDEDALMGIKSSLQGSAGTFANVIPSGSPSRNPRTSFVQFAQAATFIGHVDILGNVSVSGGKFFKIDHPLDPANKYLCHSAVESAEMKNIYDGVVTLNRHGRAVVRLPRWCEALNDDFRYQLTSIGAPCSTLHISREVHDGRFTIAGGSGGLKVSWQVTGVRRDAWAKANPIRVEQVKSKDERGHYLHPELYPGVRTRPVEKTVHPAIAKALDRLKRLRESAKRRKRLEPAVKKRREQILKLRKSASSATKRGRGARRHVR
jgi:hypothetical protein